MNSRVQLETDQIDKTIHQVDAENHEEVHGSIAKNDLQGAWER